MKRRGAAGSAVALTVTLTAIAVPTALSARPAALFKPGFDLCKAAPLSAVKKAGGQPYRAGRFDGHVCNWERADLKAGITLSVVTGAEAAAMKPRIAAVHGTATGPGGVKMHRVAVAGASAAVIETLPSAVKGELSKALLAVFPQGIAHVNMTAPGSLPDSRVLAVGAALTG